MPRDFLDEAEWAERQQGDAAGRQRGLQDRRLFREDDELAPPGRYMQPHRKDSLSTLKDYVIVALIAVITFMGINNYIFARTGGYGYQGGGGGCCVGRSGTAALSAEDLQQIGLEYYAANYGDAEVEAVVQDFGCHQEIHIYKDGELIKRIGYADGQVYEL